MNEKEFLYGLEETMRDFEKIKAENKELSESIKIAHGAMVKAINENHCLKAEIKRKDGVLECAIGSICYLCKRLNPQHRDFTSCSEIDDYRQALMESIVDVLRSALSKEEEG